MSLKGLDVIKVYPHDSNRKREHARHERVDLKAELARYHSAHNQNHQPQQPEGLDLTNSDVLGRSNLLIKKTKKHRSDYRGMRSDASLVPPIRQTASIFKQPVTVIRTQPDSKTKADFKHGTQEKPKQLFWEKRLECLQACDIDGREFNGMRLPRSLRTIGSHITDETILQSVATALHVSSQPVTGQTALKSNLESNPAVYLNPEQPLVQAVAVSEEDIKRQEERVILARKKLQEALSMLK